MPSTWLQSNNEPNGGINYLNICLPKKKKWDDWSETERESEFVIKTHLAGSSDDPKTTAVCTEYFYRKYGERHLLLAVVMQANSTIYGMV